MCGPNFKHGMSVPKNGKIMPEYRAYVNAKRRCTNPNYEGYARYGGRGIRFLFTSFLQFLEELGYRPSSKHSLDRYPNGDGHYQPGNVRWATSTEQMRNSSTTRLSEEVVLNIRKLHSEGMNNECLSAKFEVSESLISQVVRGKLWRDVDGPVRGTKSGNPKLNIEIVRKIRQLVNLTGVELARRYNISASQVCNIRKCKCWKEN